MKNNTKSKITIKMKHLDNAERLCKFIKSVREISGCGGDLELCIKSNGEQYNFNFIGHDVDIINVDHEIQVEEDNSETRHGM